MATVFHEQKEFADIDYSEKILRNRSFSRCTFLSCHFLKSDLKTNSFEDCTFENCDLSMMIVDGARFSNAQFRNCKILGVDFTQCNSLSLSFRFEQCIMDYCSFAGSKLRATHFIHCSLKEVDFSKTDLTAAVFNRSDLTGAIFSNTLLEKADFVEAVNFIIDPERNRMKKAKFSVWQLEALLYKHQLDIDTGG